MVVVELSGNELCRRLATSWISLLHGNGCKVEYYEKNLNFDFRLPSDFWWWYFLFSFKILKILNLNLNSSRAGVFPRNSKKYFDCWSVERTGKGWKFYFDNYDSLLQLPCNCSGLEWRWDRYAEAEEMNLLNCILDCNIFGFTGAEDSLLQIKSVTTFASLEAYVKHLKLPRSLWLSDNRQFACIQVRWTVLHVASLLNPKY